ncbi:two-component sensor histidine kinase [Arthrobacter pityocampae]|uniref:Sensor histidine kinase MtrB n=1 Tax=Arthrobacter pityocampae TaxID=547334 RepID=A0A2S5J1U6_9MICC|nr:MtrAB system histidine kinase MtrB [Arthrobacter pityocampae]PPB50802.1 two-component sensor histidine kinase [Arthrobacter pityocampae]
MTPSTAVHAGPGTGATDARIADRPVPGVAPPATDQATTGRRTPTGPVASRLHAASARSRSLVQSVAQHWRRSLQFRTVVATMLLTSVSFVAVGGFLSNQIAGALYDQRFDQFSAEATEELTRTKAVFRDSSATDSDTTSRLVLDSVEALVSLDTDAPRHAILVPISGNVLIPTTVSQQGVTASMLPPDLQDTVADSPDIHWAPMTIPVTESGATNAPGIAFGTQVQLPPDQASYALYVYYDLSAMQTTLDDIHRVLWLAGVVLLLVIGAIAWYVTRSVVRPVSHAASVSEKLAAGQLQERMEVRGEDEVARLGVSFNHMAGSLQDQITQLAQLSQMQQRFVSDVSHELRTPLTTVRMAAEVLHDAREEFDPVNKRSAEILFDQVERFQDLLADLLEISRFDAGAAVLEAESVDIVQLVQHAIDGARPLAERLGSDLTIVAQGTRCIVEADARRIDRILRNLIVNALEHGEGKPTEIHIACGPEAVAVAVRDHGIGMTTLQASRAFDRFWRADPARARTTGGSGLGLSIAMEDARLHNAWLEAWGRPGEGACFRLTLPRTQGTALTSSPLALPPPPAVAGPGPGPDPSAHDIPAERTREPSEGE